MNRAMSQKELEKLLDRAIREVTEQTTGVRLYQGGGAMGEDLCTVHISFRKGFRTSLTLRAETELLAHMARDTMKIKELTDRDLEEFSKEYLNILCGRIAAILFRTTRVPARFSVPVFYRGYYEPEDHRVQMVLTYFDNRERGAQLIHYVPCSPEDE